jgi:uncharacterized protein (TIGR03435 family)
MLVGDRFTRLRCRSRYPNREGTWRVDLARKLLLTLLGSVAVAVPTMYCQAPAPSSAGQSPALSQEPVATPSAPATTAQVPSFEVASIRPSPPDDNGNTSVSNLSIPGFKATRVTPRFLAMLTYGIRMNHILGGPNWFDSQLYDINAKSEGDRVLTLQERRVLLQQLLKDRFHLVVHRETEDLPGYVLVVAKGAPKLQVSHTSGLGYILPDGLQFPGSSLKEFASILENVTGRPVIDKTGITGTFSIKLKYAPMDDPDSPLPSVFTALQDQLGLKLIPQKVPVEELVIDHIDKAPTEN